MGGCALLCRAEWRGLAVMVALELWCGEVCRACRSLGWLGVICMGT
jgi:hypothetical protein